MLKPRKSSPASRSSRPTTTTQRWRSPVLVRPDTSSRSAKWPATHERTARAGGALFSPRVRPAQRRADPVAEVTDTWRQVFNLPVRDRQVETCRHETCYLFLNHARK